jgi:glycosyltransferase involved in cell wall biosynthesis
MTNTAPTILMVVTEDWYFLSHRLQLALAAKKLGMRIVVATGPGERSNEIVAAGFEHKVFSLDRRSTNPVAELKTITELVATMRGVRPDIVHLVAAKPIVYGNIASVFAGRPKVLCAIAGLGYLYLGEGLGRTTMRALYEGTFRTLVCGRPTTKVLVQNSDDAAFFVSRGMARRAQMTVIVGSGVDVERFRATAEPQCEPLVILTHSRMLWDKGIGELVAAARILKKVGDLPKFVIRLVGEPDNSNPASIPSSQLKAWCTDESVEWLGHRDDIPKQLEQCHIACLPSYREGAPLSLLEAAAAARAIVTTDVPGCREVVRHEDNGLLVPVREAPSLAKALRRLIEDPALRLHMGRRGRERAERQFAAGVVNDRIIQMYREMLSNQTQRNV